MTTTARYGLTALAGLALLAGSLSAAADTREGERVFRNQCHGCHALEAGFHRAGPSLHGIVGRQAGSLEDFDYSPAFEGVDFTWDAERLDAFLADPEAVLPGSRMVLWGLADAPRAAVIRYLEAQ